MTDNNPLNHLEALFDTDRGSEQMMQLLMNESVADIRCNAHDRIFFTDNSGPQMVSSVFGAPSHYKAWIDRLLQYTDLGYHSLADVTQPVIEGSFTQARTQGNVKGSIIILTEAVTQGEPAIVIRKQPKALITLDQMLEQRMMNDEMRLFLETAVRGRLNILLSGGSGAGKTTLARAMSYFIDPAQRVLTAEEIDELHLDDRLPNVVALKTWVKRDAHGAVVAEENLEDLVRHGLRMRADRIWVGETRGHEAAALVKSCLSGHDGSVTTVHANNAAQAARQVTSYVMEAGLPEEVARDHVSQAFHLAIQVSKVRLGRRVITEIVELEPTREGTEQRKNDLYKYDLDTDTFKRVGTPTQRLTEAARRHNANFDEALLDDHLRDLYHAENWD